MQKVKIKNNSLFVRNKETKKLVNPIRGPDAKSKKE